MIEWLRSYKKNTCARASFLIKLQAPAVPSLVECCGFFSINLGYISDPLHDAKISSICLFGVEEWSAGGVCGTRLGLAIKSPEHRLDVVLVSLLVALDDFHTLYWCFVCDWFLVHSGWRLVQRCYLRAWSIASAQLWFLYYRLWTGFRHHIFTFYSVWNTQSSAFYPAQWLKWRHFVVVTCGLCHLTAIKACHFTPYLLARMAMESFH